MPTLETNPGEVRLSFLKWLTANRLGTHLLTRRKGEKVGDDEFGNVYYRERGAKDWRRERRWVVYAGEGEIEPSAVPAGWHGWLRHNFEKPPSEQPLTKKYWEQEHQPNLSGTPLAYVPQGHERRGGKRAPATGDYEPWRPGAE